MIARLTKALAARDCYRGRNDLPIYRNTYLQVQKGDAFFSESPILISEVMVLTLLY
jgi:hypothetical protein